MMISIRDLHFSYGRRKIIDNLSFDAARGECVVLAGPNGSGKSTLLALAAGVLRASSGQITVRGRVGYVPQGTALFADATVEENLRFFADLARVPLPKHFPFAVEQYKKKKLSALSGGMKKQVSIACALLGDPEVILLDEPCAALDLGFRAEMADLVLSLKEQGRTVLYVGHDPAEFCAFCDRLVFFGDSPRVLERRELAEEDEYAFREAFETLLIKSKRK